MNIISICVCVVQVTFGPFGQYMYGLEGARTVDSRFSLMVSCSTEDGLEAPRGKEKKALGCIHLTSSKC